MEIEELDEKLYETCFLKAVQLYKTGNYNIDVFQIAELLYKLEEEKKEKEKITDSLIDYNDEITEIEDVGELECMDISVSGDNLFYCNGILTKNSWGLPQTADFMLALISTEELENSNQILCKVLKNRYNDPNYYKRFIMGVDRSRMKLYDVDESEQDVVKDDKSVFDKSRYGETFNNEKIKNKFKKFSD